MRSTSSPISSRASRLTCTVAAVSFGWFCATTPPAYGNPYSLTDNGSTAWVDVSSSAGMYHWDLGYGGNQLNQQWFWYRIGGGVAQPINTIGSAVVGYYNNANILEVSYTSTSGPLFTLTVSYTLNGGLGTADILETISVQNNSGSKISDFNLFQYSDFNLLGTPGGDSVNINYNGVGYDLVVQNEGSSAIGETINQPNANFAEAGYVNTTLNNLTTIAGYNLNNNLTAGPGDVAWAFQWVADIENNQSLDIFKDKGISLSVIPEPSVLALVALGLGVAGSLRRRKV